MSNSSFNFAVDVVDRLAEHPEAVALEWHRPGAVPLRVTFRDLKLRSDKVADVLHQYGTGYGDRVLILLPLCVAWWESVLGCMKAGGVAMLGEDVSSPERLLAQLIAFRASTIIASMSITGRIDAMIMHTPVACKISVGWERDGWVDYDRRVSLAPSGFVPAATRPEDPCLVLLPDAPGEEPRLCRHGDARFDLDLLDAWREGMTIIVREEGGGMSKEH
jgi:acyl-coenzyme A synthetase/AMP-(fatty) acid ligase